MDYERNPQKTKRHFKLSSTAQIFGFFLLVGVFSVGTGIFLVRDINTAMGEALIKVGSMLALTLLMAAGVLNVTERGKRLRVIQLSEERLNAVIESINDGMFVVAHDGQVEMVNQAAEKRWSQPRFRK